MLNLRLVILTISQTIYSFTDSWKTFAQETGQCLMFMLATIDILIYTALYSELLNHLKKLQTFGHS